MQGRSRKRYAVLTIVVMVSGLLSRKAVFLFPEVVTTYLGDALWALMIFFGVLFLFPKLKTYQAWLVSLLFCWFIEATQLYHAPWIDALRGTTLGGLILGFGFLWSDIVAYTLGTFGGALIDRALIRLDRRRK